MELKMKLLVWVGDFGLISMSMECICAIAYVKLVNAPVQLHFLKNPYGCCYQDYPIFQHGNVLITNFNDMLDYLRAHDYFLDSDLNIKQINEVYALFNMVISNLRPIFYYVYWIDKKNYEEIVSAWYTKVMPIPVNLLYARRKRKEAQSFMEIMYPNENEDKLLFNAIYESAAKCFCSLATRLKRYDYFYDDSPTSLDAVLYAYLAPLVKIPFPSDHIPKLLASWPELLNYVERVDHKLFPDIAYNEKYVKKQQRIQRSKDKHEDKYATSVVIKFFVCGAIACAMIGYAASNKIIDVEKWKDFIIGQ